MRKRMECQCNFFDTKHFIVFGYLPELNLESCQASEPEEFFYDILSGLDFIFHKFFIESQQNFRSQKTFRLNKLPSLAIEKHGIQPILIKQFSNFTPIKATYPVLTKTKV